MCSQNAPVGSPKLFLTAQGVNRGGSGSTAFRVWPRSSDAIDALSDAMRAPAHHKTGPRSTVGVLRAPRTTSPAQNAGNHRTAAAASRSTRDELRASRALVRETTGPAAGSGLQSMISDTAMPCTVAISGIEGGFSRRCLETADFPQRTLLQSPRRGPEGSETSCSRTASIFIGTRLR